MPTISMIVPRVCRASCLVDRFSSISRRLLLRNLLLFGACLLVASCSALIPRALLLPNPRSSLVSMLPLLLCAGSLPISGSLAEVSASHSRSSFEARSRISRGRGKFSKGFVRERSELPAVVLFVAYVRA